MLSQYRLRFGITQTILVLHKPCTIFAQTELKSGMTKNILDKIEYIIVLVAGFASQTGCTETEAYRYLSDFGAIALCEKHYAIMHTLSVEDNIKTLRDYCQRKGGSL